LRSLSFTKMQSWGNDFIIVDGPVDLSDEEIARLCDRRFGIGADGVLSVSYSDPIRLSYWNADGRSAELCGNGLRCAARYVYDKGAALDRNFMVQTAVGTRGVKVAGDSVEAEIGRPAETGRLSIEGERFSLIDVGNPHAVTIVDDPHLTDVERVGAALQTRFDGGINVEFAAVSADGVMMRVWERGVGKTMACGTGMVAAAFAAMEAGDLKSPITVGVPGGTGEVRFRDGVAWLRGPVGYSFRGNVGER